MFRILRVIKPIMEKSSSSFVNCSRMQCSTTEGSHTDQTKAAEDQKPDQLGGFAKAYEKHGDIANSKEVEEKYTFASLLRNSKLIDLGDPVGKTVIGKIYHTVGDDLYIDFGWKFHCVCTRPTNRPEEYVRGAKVRIVIKDLELSSRFLGSSTDLTLLEADCRLLGIVTSPTRASTVDKK